jgi:1-acyl-sn-glycerol-3-phosphate acyltransferase
MARLKAVGKALVAFVLTLFSVLAVLTARVLFRRGPRQRRWIHRVYAFWGRRLARLLHVDLKVIGTPPDPPFLLVTNHLSYLDVFLLSSVADCTFVAKAEIDGWPLMGLACRAVDTVFIDREKKRDVLRAGDQITRVLAEGRGVVLFAEGTTSCGQTILPLRSPLLAGAAEQRIPVHWAVLHYATDPESPPAGDAVCWWGEAELAPHFLTLARLPRIYATVSFGAEPIDHENRKILARRLHRAMVEAFIPIPQSEEPCSP